jgi:hypothetical protein
MSHIPIFPSDFVFEEYPLFRRNDVLSIHLEHQFSICQCENHVEFPCTNSKDKSNSEKCKDCRVKGSDCNRFYQRKRKKKQKANQQNSHPDQETDQQNSHPDQETDQQNSHPDQETDQLISHPDQETDQQNSHPDQETDQLISHPDQETDQQNSHPDQETDQQNSHPDQETDQLISHPDQETDQLISHPDQADQETEQLISHPDQETDQLISNPDQETDQLISHLDLGTDQLISHPDQETDQLISHPDLGRDQQRIVRRLSLLQNVDCFEISVLSSSILSKTYSPLYPEFVAADGNCFWHAVLLQLHYNKIIWNKNEAFVGLRFRGRVNAKSLHERFAIYLTSNENTIRNRIRECVDLQFEPTFYRTLCSTWGKFQDNAQLVILIICIALNCEGMIVQAIKKANGGIDFIPNLPYIMNEGSGRSGRISLLLENSQSVMSSRSHYWSLSVFT